MGLLAKIKGKIFPSVKEGDNNQEADYLISFGVLLWVVGEADDKFLPEEISGIERILSEQDGVTQEDLPVIMQAIKEAASLRIDIHSFTRECVQVFDREGKIKIVDNLFRVACVDGDLDLKEHEAIRQISKLFRLDHDDFISSKVKVKKEFGIDTVGL